MSAPRPIMTTDESASKKTAATNSKHHLCALGKLGVLGGKNRIPGRAA